MICEICDSEIRDDAAFCPFCGTRVTGGPTYDNYVYEAFISYRHLPHDTKVATRLQRSLEGFRLPRGITRDDGGARLGKLFRDQDELPTSQSLGDQIEGALKQSRRLVVIATPQTNESQWVQREVETFASFHGREAIIIALAAGEPSESFPTLMRNRLVRDGRGDVTSIEEEPIAADFRDGTRKQFDLERLRVAANIIGCGFDELRQRQHARKMRVVAIATSAAAVFSTAFGSFSMYQQRQIEENYRQALIKESESLAVESAELLAQGDRMQAIQVALAALPQSSTSDDRPLVPAAQLALERALQVYPTESYWRSCYSISDTEGAYAANEEGLQAFLKTDGTIQVCGLADGLEVCTFRPEDVIASQKPEAVAYLYEEYSTNRLEGQFSLLDNGKLLWFNQRLYCLFDATTGELVWTITLKHRHFNETIHLSEDQEYLAIARYYSKYAEGQLIDSATVSVFTTKDGKRKAVYGLPFKNSDANDLDNKQTFQAAFSPDGKMLAVANYGQLYLVDLTSGEVQCADLQQPYAYSLDFAGDAIVAVTKECRNMLDEIMTYADDYVYLDVFDMNLKPLWQTHELLPMQADNQLTSKPTKSLVAGVTEDTGDLILAVGSSIVIYDRDTGEELSRTQTTEPIVACENLNGGFCLVDSSGWLFFSSAEADAIAMPLDHYTLQTTTTEKADFVLGDDGFYLAQWDDGTSSYRVYRATMRFDSPGRDPFDGSSLMPLDHLWYDADKPAEKGSLVINSDDSLISLDLETLETLWRIPTTPLAEGKIITAALEDDMLGLVSSAASDGLRISLLSWEDGSLIDSFEPKVESSSVYQLRAMDYQGAKCLLLAQPKALRIYDIQTHRELATLARDDESSMADTWYTDEWALTLSSGDEQRSFQALSLKTGEHVASDIEDCTVPGWKRGTLAASLDTEERRFAVVDVTGTIRLYRTEDWSLVWEGPVRYPKAQHIVFSRDGRHLMLQSQTGVCTLLSAEDGSVVTVSATELPPITSSSFIDDDALVARYTIDGYRPSFGTALISLDPECFGPLDDVYNGLLFTFQKQRAFAIDESAEKAVVFHHYTLDELIELGHETVQGHELTDAERYLYRID